MNFVYYYNEYEYLDNFAGTLKIGLITKEILNLTSRVKSCTQHTVTHA
jgi:hypothetical protein